jgi:CHAD domain-containing protein
LETTLKAIGEDDHKNESRLLRDMAKIRKRAGRVRDMDVLVRSALTVNVKEERDCLLQLL